MKNLLCIALLLSAVKLQAQFTFEHKYDSAATYNFCMGNASQLLMVNLEVSGERYVRINRCGKKMNLYNLSHQAVKTIDLSFLPLESPYNTVGTILYLSEHLFNNDAKLEFMYILTSGATYSTMVYSEDGTMLFSEPGAPMIIPNIHLQQYPVYNTTAGTKLILSYQNGEAKVFGLAGKLTTAIQKATSEFAEAQMYLSASRPNPSNESTDIYYTLPEKSPFGFIAVYDAQGR
jgi:hypothetical protein